MKSITSPRGRSAVLFITKTAVLSALSVILMYLNFGVIPGFMFLKLDFADVPVLIGGFAMNPLAAFVIIVVKILFTLLKTYSVGIGELSNFICSLAFVLPATLLYHYRKSFRTAVLGLIIGIALELVASSLSNYYLIFPMYIKVMTADGIDILNGMTLSRVIVSIVLPFNLLKTGLTALIVLAVYKPLSRLFKRIS